MKYFNFHGVRVKIQSHSSEFEEFLENNFYYFSENEKESKYDLEVNYKEELNIKELKDYKKIGSNAYQLNDKFIFFSKDQNMIYKINVDKNSFRLNLNYSFEKGVKFKIKKALKNIKEKKISTKVNYLKLSRELINFPVFWILEKKYGIHLIHGGAVSSEKECFVFSGLANVGKSTNTLALTLDYDFLFLSDNFLLYDEKYVYSFPELLRISDATKNLVKNQLEIPDYKYIYNKRKYYQLSKSKILKKSKINNFIVPALGTTSYLEKITSSNFINLMMLSNDFVKEFHNYNIVGLLDFCLEDKNYYLEKILKLEKLVENSEIKKVIIDKNKDFNYNYKFFKEK